MSDEDNVIHAFPTTELPDNPILIAPKPPGVPYHCHHQEIRLDAHDRTVQCAKCGAILDPFNFLMNQAATLQMAWANYHQVRRELSEVHDRVIHLKKEEQRIKARLKRQQEKLSTVVLYDPDKQT